MPRGLRVTITTTSASTSTCNFNSLSYLTTSIIIIRIMPMKWIINNSFLTTSAILFSSLADWLTLRTCSSWSNKLLQTSKRNMTRSMMKESRASYRHSIRTSIGSARTSSLSWSNWRTLPMSIASTIRMQCWQGLEWRRKLENNRLFNNSIYKHIIFS